MVDRRRTAFRLFPRNQVALPDFSGLSKDLGIREANFAGKADDKRLTVRYGGLRHLERFDRRIPYSVTEGVAAAIGRRR